MLLCNAEFADSIFKRLLRLQIEYLFEASLLTVLFTGLTAKVTAICFVVTEG